MAKPVKVVCGECRRAVGKGHKMDCTMRYKAPKDRKWVEAGTNKPYTVSLNLFDMGE